MRDRSETRVTPRWIDHQAVLPDGLLEFDPPDEAGRVALKFRPHVPAGFDRQDIIDRRRDMPKGCREWWWYGAMNPVGGSRLGFFDSEAAGKALIGLGLRSDNMGSGKTLIAEAGFEKGEGDLYIRVLADCRLELTADLTRISLRLVHEGAGSARLLVSLVLEDRTHDDKPMPIFWPSGLGTVDRLTEMVLARAAAAARQA